MRYLAPGTAPTTLPPTHALCFFQEVALYRLPPGPPLQRASSFRYLNRSKCFDADGSNVEEWGRTKHAMAVMGITQQEQESIWSVVAAILHLGNVGFRESDHNDPVHPADDASKEHLDTVAKLLG